MLLFAVSEVPGRDTTCGPAQTVGRRSLGVAGGEAVPTVESNLFEPERPSGRRLRLFGPGADPFGTTHTRVARGVQGPARTGSNDLVLRCGFATHRSGGTAWGVRINLFARPIVVLRRHPTHFCFIKQKPFGSAARIWMTA